MFDFHLIGVDKNTEETIMSIMTNLINTFPENHDEVYSITVTAKELPDSSLNNRCEAIECRSYGAKCFAKSSRKLYADRARKVLTAIDMSPIPVNWAAMDTEDLIRVIADALIKIDKEEAYGNGDHKSSVLCGHYKKDIDCYR